VVTGRAVEDHPGHEERRLERLGLRRLTAVYGGQSATMTQQNTDSVEPRCLQRLLARYVSEFVTCVTVIEECQNFFLY